MPSDIMNHWFRSHRPAQIENLQLTLDESPFARDMPLSVAYGQAEVFFPFGEDGSEYVLKVFHKSKQLDSAYLKSVNQYLPGHPSFRCGKERKILTDKSLCKTPDTYHAPELSCHLAGSVLMPRIRGLDWISFSDSIRAKKQEYANVDRLTICKNLAQVVQMLETHQVSHRDLSGGNIFIDPTSLSVSLIDFDSMYHPSLVMPRTTTIGTEGYTAPFVRVNDARSTFSPMADRFALAILCVEILILDASSPFSHEGGIFQQDELYQRKGKTISYAENILSKDHPDTVRLFKAALNSRTFQDCPRPGTWFSLAPKPSLSINDLPEVNFDILPDLQYRQVSLPNDQWINMKGSEYGLNLPTICQSYPPSNGNVRRHNPINDFKLCHPPVANPLDPGHRKMYPTVITADIQYVSSISFEGIQKKTH